MSVSAGHEGGRRGGGGGCLGLTCFGLFHMIVQGNAVHSCAHARDGSGSGSGAVVRLDADLMEAHSRGCCEE